MAFTFKSLGELLDTYTRLKESGIRPNWCINHGPTTSMYYRNPDNNQGEPLIDNFDDIREGKAYMQSPAFAKNPIGVPFEPESFVHSPSDWRQRCGARSDRAAGADSHVDVNGMAAMPGARWVKCGPTLFASMQQIG